ncbi:MAG: CYTH domain-containing protein [Gammaproteobacteria bacterium]|jgi:adenylate cyclase
MGREVERKFLVISEAWRDRVDRSVRYRQGYLNQSGNASVRVRVSDQKAHLNIKGATLGVERQEYEYEIPLAEAHEILSTLCEGPLIEKTRHYVEHAGHVWEVDVFEGDNAGLVVAEIELAEPEEAFERPDWLGEEVSHDPRYYNVCLVKHPYKDWNESETGR